MTMKITIATGLYPPDIGGPATYTAMLEKELPGRNFSVVVVPYGWVRRYPKVFRHLAYSWKLWRESKGSQLVYALDPVSVGLPALIVSRLRKLRFLLRVPGDYAWEQGQFRYGVTDTFKDFIEKRFSYGWRVSMLCLVESFVSKRAERVIVPSAYMRVAIQKWGVQADNIQTIYSVLHPLPVSGNKQDLQKQLEFVFPTLISAGRLVPNKGFVVLIKAFSEIKTNYPAAQLVIVGDGPQEQELRQCARECGVEDSVRLLGRLSKEAMGAAIKAADVFVLNTAHESLSHQILEVMDIETPIVTTAVGGNTELITDNESGLLVPYNDIPAIKSSITKILENPSLRDRIVKAAKEKSQQFEQKVMIDQIEKVLLAYGKH